MASRKLTAGALLVRRLTRDLEDGLEWSESERVTLDLLRDAADRRAILVPLLDAEAGKPEVSTRRVTELAAELRQLEAQLSKWIASLDPAGERVKSARHVAAANARWSNRAANG